MTKYPSQRFGPGEAGRAFYEDGYGREDLHGGGEPAQATDDTHDRNDAMDDSGEQQAWHQVRRTLRADLGDNAFDSWLRPLDLLGVDGGVVTLSVPTKFMRDWVGKRYLERLVAAWKDVLPSVERVDILLNGGALPPCESRNGTGRSTGAPLGRGPSGERPQTKFPPKLSGQQGDFGRPGPAAVNPGVPGQRQDPRTDSPAGRTYGEPAVRSEDESELRERLEDKYTFDQFVVGKSNELAHAACRRVAESQSVPFNPLFLHGGTGLGKTHLMHATAWEIRRRNPGRNVMCLSAEKFMYRFVSAIRHHSQMAFKEQFRNVDVLMIDDFQFLSGKSTTQEEFFHTFNTLVDRNRQVIISADRSPSDLENIEERIRSRLSWGLVADIHPTDFELRLGILQSKARQAAEVYGAVEISNQVLDFLAHKITSNVRELEGALHRILAHAALVGRAINVDMAQEVLRPMIRANSRRVTVEEIQRRVADYFDLKHQDMLSPRRARVVSRPRQIAMYLSKQLTTRSLPDIGRRFGGRDHTTVMHAVKRIEELRRTDVSIDEAVENLRRLLEG